jgi:hypothetical protein
MDDNLAVTINENAVDVQVCENTQFDITLESDGCSQISQLSEGLDVDIFQSLIAASGLDIILNEIPQGVIDGINSTFTLMYNFVGSRLSVYLNGLKLSPNDFIKILPNQFQLIDSPLTGDLITADYVRRVTSGGIGEDELFELDENDDIQPT